MAANAPLALTEIDATRRWVRDHQTAGRTVGLVPTMGALHEGHLSLARAANSECDVVLTTVFVNPTQFGPGEDYERYPRDVGRDMALLSEVGVDAVFAPTVEAMYPADSVVTIDVGDAGRVLEGRSRPTHFAGVATVVAKLFAIAPADRAYFGQKDYQQTVVLRRLVKELFAPTELVICPIVREPDGLAMSSRNAYLSPAEREQATALSRGLGTAQRLHAAGERDAGPIRDAVEEIVRAADGVTLDYVAVVAEGTLREVETLDGPAVVAVAARVGQTRLIDNVRLP